MKFFPQFPRTRSKPSETLQLPFNSSLPEAEQLKALRSHSGWKAMVALLERVAQADYNLLAQGLEYEAYHQAVGAYQRSRAMVDLVDNIIEKAERIHEHGRESGSAGRDHERSILFGSPDWGK